MSTLFKQIKSAAVDANEPLANLLRKCAVLGAELKNDELRDWAFRELKGYDGEETVPAYRVIGAAAKGNLAGPFNSGYNNISIPAMALPKKLQEQANRVQFRDPIAGLEAAIAKDSGHVVFNWPGNWIAWVQNEGKFEGGLMLWAAWQDVSIASIVGIVDTVRNRILEFCLLLEKQSPELLVEETAALAQPIQAAARQVYNQVFILGDNSGNIANSSPGASQTATTVKMGDITALVKALTEVGVPPAEVEELQTAIAHDPVEKGPSKGSGEWLAKASKAVANGTWKLASGVGTSVITKLVLSYFGIPA